MGKATVMASSLHTGQSTSNTHNAWGRPERWPRNPGLCYRAGSGRQLLLALLPRLASPLHPNFSTPSCSHQEGTSTDFCPQISLLCFPWKKMRSLHKHYFWNSVFARGTSRARKDGVSVITCMELQWEKGDSVSPLDSHSLSKLIKWWAALSPVDFSQPHGCQSKHVESSHLAVIIQV